MAVRTSSAWGRPPSRYYIFLEKLQQLPRQERVYNLGVLGCADGKFVVPAARKGLNVLAIDCDKVALFGGPKPWLEGDMIVDGLIGRLRKERLEERVSIRCGDFLRLAPEPCMGLWVSGAIQYSFNMPHSAKSILEKITAFCAVGGLLYIDYMLPYEEKYQGRPNCPDATWWKRWCASLTDWSVLHHRVLPPTRDRAHVEYPVDHFHQWGHLLMRRCR